jgi:hypothetical protein
MDYSRVYGNKKSSERDIEIQVLTYLNLKQGFFWKAEYPITFDSRTKVAKQASHKFIINGISDVLGVYNTIFYAIEIKTPNELKWWAKKHAEIMGYGGKNKKEKRFRNQQLFIDNIKTHGGWGGFAASVEEAWAIVLEGQARCRS